MSSASVSSLRPLLIAGLAGLLLVACKQDSGDRCEVTSDCKSGLTCDYPPGSTYNGVCTATPSTPGVDAGVGNDGGAGTGGSDARGTGGAGGSAPPADLRTDIVDAPAAETGETGGADSGDAASDAVDARDAVAG